MTFSCTAYDTKCHVNIQWLLALCTKSHPLKLLGYLLNHKENIIDCFNSVWYFVLLQLQYECNMKQWMPYRSVVAFVYEKHVLQSNGIFTQALYFIISIVHTILVGFRNNRVVYSYEKVSVMPISVVVIAFMNVSCNME